MSSIPRTFSVPLNIRLDTLERRMGKVEDALNSVLSRFNLPPIEKESLDNHQPSPQSIEKDGPYTYRSLDVSRSEIRILAVQNTINEQDPIRCELIHISIDEKLAATRTPSGRKATYILRMYNTLSYTWGDSEKTGSVIIDGYQFPVTMNLESALRAMRRLKSTESNLHPALMNQHPSYWWIDALCINQDDILERNSQVLYMTRIYKNGMGVNVWLGDEGDNSSMALDLARQLGTYQKKGPGEPETVYPEVPIENKIEHWQTLTSLFQRPWWGRCWVRQEVAVHCGDQSCQFDAVVAVANILNNMNEILGFKPVGHEAYDLRISSTTGGTLKLSCYLQACMLADVRRDSRHGSVDNFVDFKEMLFHTRACKATDLRDKVISVLSLVDPELYGMKADYRLPVRNVLMQAARCIITKKQALDLLSGCQNPERANDLPSWVPNLLDAWKARPFKGEIRHSVEPVAILDFTFDTEESLVLRAKGKRLGVIEIDKQYLEQELLGQYKYRWWVELLSIGEDDGRDMRYSEEGQLLLDIQPSVVKAYMNPKMARSLLLPKDEDEEAIKVNPYHKIHSYLRKYGVGRNLCVTENSKIGLVPADSTFGDEIVGFRRTVFPYVLRKMGDEGYVVVGEAYFPKYVDTMRYSVKTQDLEDFSII